LSNYFDLLLLLLTAYVAMDDQTCSLVASIRRNRLSVVFAFFLIRFVSLFT